MQGPARTRTTVVIDHSGSFDANETTYLGMALHCISRKHSKSLDSAVYVKCICCVLYVRTWWIEYFPNSKAATTPQTK